LMKQDQMSMAASVESRVPFLDHELVEWVARVPEHYKVRGFSGKYLLRKAMADRLPAEIINRHKKGFPTPIRPWLRNQLFGKVSSVLSDGRLADRQFIRAEYIESMLERHRRGDAAATEGCWRLLTFEMWNRIFFDGERSQIESQTDRVKRAALCA
jgi:asparagine synthase (glutamine-hydrolysing)